MGAQHLAPWPADANTDTSCAQGAEIGGHAGVAESRPGRQHQLAGDDLADELLGHIEEIPPLGGTPGRRMDVPHASHATIIGVAMTAARRGPRTSCPGSRVAAR